MPYQINLSNGTALVTIPDDTLDTGNTSLTLIGPHYTDYGAVLNDNFVRLLENSTNTISPPNPLKGQLWYNPSTSIMNLWNGTAWVNIVAGSGLATLASPTFTGTPAAPTVVSASDATTKLATTGFVQNAIAAVPQNTNLLLNPLLNVQQMHAVGSHVIISSTSAHLNDCWRLSANGTPSMDGFTAALVDADKTAIGDEAAEYGFSVSTANTPGSSDYALIEQRLEDLPRFANKTVTFSFWAHANISANVCIELVQVFGTGGSPTNPVIGIGSQLVALTSTWTHYTTTPIAIPSIVGKTFGTDPNSNYLALRIWLTGGASFNTEASNIGGQTFTLNMWNPKLQFGSLSMPTMHRPYAQELAICQRYYEIGGANVAGYGITTTQPVYTFPYKVNKRIVPIVTDSGGGTNFVSSSLTSSTDSIVLSILIAANGGWTLGFNWTADARL